MKRGLKTFARSVRDRKQSKVDEMLDKIVQGNMRKDMWEGYQRALRGISEALGSEDGFRFVHQIAEERFSMEKLEDIRAKMKERASQEFRPEDERGYNKAWADVLKVIIEDAKEN